MIIAFIWFVGLILSAILFQLAYNLWWIGIISYLFSSYIGYECIDPGVNDIIIDIRRKLDRVRKNK